MTIERLHFPEGLIHRTASELKELIIELKTKAVALPSEFYRDVEDPYGEEHSHRVSGRGSLEIYNSEGQLILNLDSGMYIVSGPSGIPGMQCAFDIFIHKEGKSPPKHRR